MNWYKTSQTNPFGLGESQYSATVRVNASEYGPNNEWEAVIDDKSVFHYNIELEHRSWGIKGISVSFQDILKETIVITYFDKDGSEIRTEDRPITIDMSKLPVEYVNGNGIYVTDIDISLTPNLEIDYGSSSITVVKGMS